MSVAQATSRALERGVGLLRRRPGLGDAVLVVLLLIPALSPRVGDLETTTAARAISVALVLPLLVRRRWPLAVFAALALIALGQWAFGVRAVGDAALLVALYTVAVSQPTRVAVGAGIVVEIGVVMALARWGDGDPARAFVGLTGLAVAAAVTGTSTRNRRRLVTTLEERAARLERERDQQGQLSASLERARIAREMHDIIAHNLSVMVALADGASYAIHDDPQRARSAMQTASRTGRQALAEMRRLLGVLRSDDDPEALSPQPAIADLDALVAQVRTAGLPVEFEVCGRPAEALPGGMQLAVHRIVQEALTNTLKHAGPGATARLTIRYDRDGLEVEVTDTGAATASAASGPGAGLRGMQERAALYDGDVEAGRAAGGGWRVRLALPLARPLATA